MKIAFLEINATTSFGGVQTGVWNFANEFTREGHEVTVIGGTGSIGNPFGGSIKTITFPFVPRERFPGLGLPFPFKKFAERFSFALGGRVRAAVKTGGYDWVILHKPLDFFWPWIPGMPHATRFAFYSGGTDFLPFDRTLVRKVKALFACSNFNAWQLLDHYGRRARVTYNGVDTEKFAPNPQREALRASQGFGAHEIIFGYAGRLVGFKGVYYAIHAIASEVLRDLPVRLVFAGDGPARGELERLSRELGVASRVTFLGALKHAAVAAFYNSCDVGVVPSATDEAFGTSIAEAMSCGIPVIGSYLGGIPEVVGNEGSCGLLVPPGDPRALAEAMRVFAVSPQLRFDGGRQARERIRNNFTWRQAAQRFLEGLCEHGGAQSSVADSAPAAITAKPVLPAV